MKKIVEAFREYLSMPKPLTREQRYDVELRTADLVLRSAVKGLRWAVALILCSVTALIAEHFWPNLRVIWFGIVLLVWHYSAVSVQRWNAQREAYAAVCECEDHIA